MTHDVFISYSSKDKPIADAICAHLEAAGERCWIAPRDIAPGEDWPSAITRGISQSSVMVLVFSASSNSSEDVSRELFLGANSKLVIIPFKIENVEPEPGKQYYLARTHWLDAINPPTQEQIQELVDRVKALVPPRGPAIAAPQPVPAPLPRPVARPVVKKSGLSPWLLLIPAGALLLCLLGLLGWGGYSLFLKPPAAPLPPTASPTLVPATAVPTQAATATVPAAPTISSGPAVIFLETFDSNLNGWETGTETDDSGDVTRQIVDGKYRQVLSSRQPYLFAITSVPKFTGRDYLFSIEATVVDTNAPPGDLVIEFTLREPNGVNGKRYDFSFYSDNTYIVDVWPSSDYTTVKTILTGTLGNARLEKGITNTFAVRASGSSFTVDLNSAQIGTFTDTTFAEGGTISLWLGLTKADQSATIDFDNLVIKSIP